MRNYFFPAQTEIRNKVNVGKHNSASSTNHYFNICSFLQHICWTFLIIRWNNMRNKSGSADCMYCLSSDHFIHRFSRDQIFLDVNVRFPSSETVTCMCTKMHPRSVILVFYCFLYACQIWNNFCFHCTCCLGECSSVKADYSHTTAKLRPVYTHLTVM